jgi:hypothetical protein
LQTPTRCRQHLLIATGVLLTGARAPAKTIYEESEI